MINLYSWQSSNLAYIGLPGVPENVFYYVPTYVFSHNCGDPGTPRNGQRSLSSTTYNSVVTYTCDVGYSLQGTNSRKCLYTGWWKGSVPSAVES